MQNAYTFDNSGQRLTNQTTSPGISRTEQYGYDELNRLKTVDYGDGQTQYYAFDGMGNRSSKQDSTTGTENYTYNTANKLLTRGTGSYANDADGNTLMGGGRTNTWDSQNRLVQCVNGANNSSFVYSSDGLRRQSTVNGSVIDFVLDNSMFIRELNHATGASIATYFAGVRGPEYRRDDATGQVRWYVYDGLGSVLGEVDPNGNITSSRKYDVYGLVRGGANPAGASSHKFVSQLGHPSENNTGLIYMRARYYDPAAGIFIGEDPGHQGTNWYSYCGSDPINRVDANGKNFLWDLVLAGFAFLLFMCVMADAPILGIICFIVGVIGMLVAVIESITWAYEKLDELQDLKLKQRSWGSISVIADAIVTELKQKGGTSAVLGWEAELVFGILEIDAF